MAAYAYTATLTTRVAKKILGFPGVGLVFGSINITNYNQTKVEVVEISKTFASGLSVVSGGMTSNGYEVVWDAVNKTFKCYYANQGFTPAGTCTMTINGGAAGTAIGIDADANNFNLTKAAATARTSTNPVAFAGSAVAASAATEVANDVNVGSFSFIAMGIVHV